MYISMMRINKQNISLSVNTDTNNNTNNSLYTQTTYRDHTLSSLAVIYSVKYLTTWRYLMPLIPAASGLLLPGYSGGCKDAITRSSQI